MKYKALTEKEARQYALQITNLFPSDAKLSVKEIGDGNLNLVFHIADEVSGRSVIIKQALPYAKVVGESWPLTLDRARIEKEALVLQKEICPRFVPEVYHYDEQLALTVMEDLSSHVILRKGLIEGKVYPKLGEHLGTFIAETTFRQSDFYLAPDVKKSRVQQFTNPELCKITEDLVFTDPYQDAETNSFNPLITDDVKRIWKNEELRAEIAGLKYTFLTAAQALLHGDLHTGSVFVTEESTKVIDPEFAYYGPIGFDLGAVLANLVLNYAAQLGHIGDQQIRVAYQGYLLNTIDTVWNSFEERFRTLAITETKDGSLAQPIFVDAFIRQVQEDALGFAGCKVLRRIIGLAGVADLESIQDPTVRAGSERLGLSLGQRLILKRREWKNAESIAQLVKHHAQQWEEGRDEQYTNIRAVGQ